MPKLHDCSVVAVDSCIGWAPVSDVNIQKAAIPHKTAVAHRKQLRMPQMLA